MQRPSRSLPATSPCCRIPHPSQPSSSKPRQLDPPSSKATLNKLTGELPGVSAAQLVVHYSLDNSSFHVVILNGVKDPCICCCLSLTIQPIVASRNSCQAPMSLKPAPSGRFVVAYPILFIV